MWSTALLNCSYQRPDSAVLWINPFYALSALQDWLGPDGGNGRSVGEVYLRSSPIVTAYFVVTLLACAGFLWLMVRRYTRAVRG